MKLQCAKNFLYISQKILFFFVLYLTFCIYTNIYFLVQLNLSATSSLESALSHKNRPIYNMFMNKHYLSLYHPDLKHLIKLQSLANLVSNPNS